MSSDAQFGIGPEGWTLLARRVPPEVRQWSLEGQDDAPASGRDLRPICRKIFSLFNEPGGPHPAVASLIARLELSG